MKHQDSTDDNARSISLLAEKDELTFMVTILMSINVFQCYLLQQ